MGTTLELTAADGQRFSAYRADPSGKPRGGLVVVQEIFGVNSHIRSVADGYAADGYLAIAPALFDRAERGVRDRLLAARDRPRTGDHAEAVDGRRIDGRRRGAEGGRVGRQDGYRRLLLGRHGRVGGSGEGRRPRLRGALLRRRHPGEQGPQAALPGDAALRRDRPRDPDRRSAGEEVGARPS